MLERVSVLSIGAVGTMLTFLPSVQQRLGVPGIGKEGFELERAAFAFGNIMAYALGLGWYVWLFHTSSAPAANAKKVV